MPFQWWQRPYSAWIGHLNGSQSYRIQCSVFGDCIRWERTIKSLLFHSIKSTILFHSQAMTASSPWQRRLCFLLPFTMRVLLTVLRVSRYGGGNPTSLTHVFLQVSLYMLFCMLQQGGGLYSAELIRMLWLCLAVYGINSI